ncbi:MAG: hypothetical protein ABSB80_10685 [Methanoregula sp.]
MDKRTQASHVKHDRPTCERCQAANIVLRPDGTYSCRRCGFDSADGKK